VVVGVKKGVFYRGPYRALKREREVNACTPSCGGYAALAWGYDY
jgi:hypothetical protein